MYGVLKTFGSNFLKLGRDIHFSVQHRRNWWFNWCRRLSVRTEGLGFKSRPVLLLQQNLVLPQRPFLSKSTFCPSSGTTCPQGWSEVHSDILTSSLIRETERGIACGRTVDLSAGPAHSTVYFLRQQSLPTDRFTYR